MGCGVPGLLVFLHVSASGIQLLEICQGPSAAASSPASPKAYSTCTRGAQQQPLCSMCSRLVLTALSKTVCHEALRRGVLKRKVGSQQRKCSSTSACPRLSDIPTKPDVETTRTQAMAADSHRSYHEACGAGAEFDWLRQNIHAASLPIQASVAFLPVAQAVGILH